MHGAWTARGLGDMDTQLGRLQLQGGAQAALRVNAAEVDNMDTAGAWVLHQFLEQLRKRGEQPTLQGLSPQGVRLLQAVSRHAQKQAGQTGVLPPPTPGALARLGRASLLMPHQLLAALAFVGESAMALAGCVAHPTRMRWRPILFNIQKSGFDALPLVGLLSLLLGMVVAYQGADQLRQYGANIFVVDLVGLSMLREFAPLITAITLAARSGSAFAAQIGTMAVTEEVDAMRTLGIAPIELLVLPKVIAMAIALPLLTVFSDAMGIAGGMLMARSQLDVGYAEFLDRLPKAVSLTSYGVGIGKAPVFAVIIAMIGCFQGFRTQGGADSVGQHTTRSVVQSVFLVIVVDALFSIAFSLLNL